MRKRALYYMILVILAGFGLVAFSLCASPDTLGESISSNWFTLLTMVVLSALMRSLPVYMNDGEQAIDMSVICITAVYMCAGARIAALVYVFSSLFVFEKTSDGSFRSVYNTELKKTLFNTAVILLSIMVPAFVCRCLGLSSASMAIPDCLGKLIAFSLLTYVVNAVLMMTFFVLMGFLTAREAVRQSIGLCPNVMAAVPIGLLIAVLYAQESGPWLVILMLLPLLLARYGWKLYLDMQKQQRLLIQAIVSTMEAKDKYTEGHSRRVQEYAELIGGEMHLNRRQMDALSLGALLHDVGKIGIDDAILRKPDKLTDEERAEMQKHTEIGVHIVSSLGFSPEVLQIIGMHHRWYNGEGYPAPKSNEERSVLIEIMGVADAYDAMTSDRAYRRHMPQAQAIAILRENAGTQFSPNAVEALVRALEKQA